MCQQCIRQIRRFGCFSIKLDFLQSCIQIFHLAGPPDHMRTQGLVLTIVYIVIVFYNEARAKRALSFGLLHWLPGQRLNY